MMGKSRYNNLLTIITPVGDSKRLKIFKHKRHIAYMTLIYLFSETRVCTMGYMVHTDGTAIVKHNTSLIGLPYGCLGVCDTALRSQPHSYESTMVLYVTKGSTNHD